MTQYLTRSELEAQRHAPDDLWIVTVAQPIAERVVARYFRRLDADMQEDCVQGAMVAMWRARENLRYDAGSNPFSHLTETAYNAALLVASKEYKWQRPRATLYDVATAGQLQTACGAKLPPSQVDIRLVSVRKLRKGGVGVCDFRTIREARPLLSRGNLEFGSEKNREGRG